MGPGGVHEMPERSGARRAGSGLAAAGPGPTAEAGLPGQAVLERSERRWSTSR